MSLYTACVFGMAALGGLIIGVLADWLDAPRALTAEGVAFLLVAVVLVPQLNRVGRQIGAASKDAALVSGEPSNKLEAVRRIVP